MPLIKNKVRLNLGKSLRLLVSGGARLEPGIARDLSKIVCKLIEGYGLTETSPVVTLNPPEKLRFGSVGKPIPGVQIKINNPDKSGIGEVLIKGPNVMQGYFQHPELTAQVIKEGWFYSGDLGYIDSRGYLFLTGREKEVIVLSSGKNIYSEELEMHFSASPFIKEICILSKREERFGSFVESLYAVVVPNLDYFRQKNEANIQGTIRWELENLSKNLPSYKHIMGFAVTKEELPRTALKKLKRYQVKKKYLEKETSPLETQEMALSPEDLQLLNKEATKKIMGYISQELNKPVQLDSHLEIDLGIDSLTRVELGLGLEALLKTKIPDEILYNVSTIRDVIMTVQGLMERNKGVAYESRDAPKTWDEILQESPADTVLKKIRIAADFLDILVILLFKCVFSFIFRVFWLLRVKGKDHLPVRGPYLLTPNHASYLDAFAIFSSLPLRGALNIFFLGYSKIFETPAISWATKISRLISIDSSTHLTEAMQAAAFILKHKKAVCIFPEGRRSIGANIGEFKKGTGILIKELDIPVVPAYIKGSYRAWPRTSRFPKFFPLKVIFGQPVSLKELTRREKEESALDDYEVIARRLREEVIKLKC
jgi:long-chain acyl-CoA synthetase